MRNKFVRAIVTVGVAAGMLGLASVGASGAEELVQEYAKGHGALEDFSGDGFAASPQWVQAWVMFMLATFAVGLLVFAWRKPIARWAAGGFILGAVFSAFAPAALGLPNLSGSIAIAHLIFWTPALVLLLRQRPFNNPEEGMAFRIWSGVMTFVILFSFIFDIRDAVIYLGHVSGIT